MHIYLDVLPSMRMGVCVCGRNRRAEKVCNLRKTNTEADEKTKKSYLKKRRRRKEAMLTWPMIVYICFSDEYADASGVVLTEC